ncbi:MAG: 2Fe-2S iron-sulfur cluster-binding protein, partial [Cardiobacterium sp.]
MSNKIRINLMRYRPDEDEKPWAQPFEIEWTQDMSILDALALLKDDFDPSIAYRWSCRMEVCGSCGMVVNGQPRLACSTFVREFADVGEITIGALDQFPIEKDLVVDLDPFINKLNAVSPFIITKNPRALAEKEYLQTPQQLAKFKQYTMCIN